MYARPLEYVCHIVGTAYSGQLCLQTFMGENPNGPFKKTWQKPNFGKISNRKSAASADSFQVRQTIWNWALIRSINENLSWKCEWQLTWLPRKQSRLGGDVVVEVTAESGSSPSDSVLFLATLRHVRKAWQGKPEAIGHVVSIASKDRQMADSVQLPVFFSSSHSVYTPVPGMVLPCASQVSLSHLNLPEKRSPKHTQVCVLGESASRQMDSKE